MSGIILCVLFPSCTVLFSDWPLINGNWAPWLSSQFPLFLQGHSQFVFSETCAKWNIPNFCNSAKSQLLVLYCFLLTPIKNEHDFCPNFAPLSWAIGEFSPLHRRIFPHLFWKLLYSNPQNPLRFRNQILNAADSFCSVEGWKQHIQTGMWDHIKCLFEQQNVFFNFVPVLTEILMICVKTPMGNVCVLVHKVISSKRQGVGSAVEFHSKSLSTSPNSCVQLGWLSEEMMTFMC